MNNPWGTLDGKSQNGDLELGQVLIWRKRCVLILMLALVCVLGLRVAQLQTQAYAHLHVQGDKRYLREVRINPERGAILDRNRQILTVSTPVESVVADPKVFCVDSARWDQVATIVGTTLDKITQHCDRFSEADFMYIQRRLPPSVSSQVKAMQLPGIELRTEYKRYYPSGPTSAHLVGFTDIDDRGQEGLEKQFDLQLRGKEGRKRVLKALDGHFVESVESIQQVQHGEDLVISIDARIQSLGSGYLEAAVKRFGASGGSVVVLAVPSGEILAMVNSPQFNPNDRRTIKQGEFRNRAVTDVLEPGSTVKPFTVAMALESGKVGPDSRVDTHPGKLRIGAHTISDVHDYGEVSVSDVVVRSSNIGVVKLALAFPFDRIYDTFRKIGFGEISGGLLGETPGVLEKKTRKIEHATFAYGYGLSVTPLQLARAYTVFATDGVLLPLTLEKREPGYVASGKRVFSPRTTARVRAMLEQVVSSRGTARKAQVPRYRVGGKTGTTHKLIDGNYVNKRYISLFAGIAPMSDPRFVMVVSIDDPQANSLYYGGDVAAPVFSNLMEDILRLYNAKPDGLSKAGIAARSENGKRA